MQEVVWITDPDEDHGDFEGYSEGDGLCWVNQQGNPKKNDGMFDGISI